MTDQHPITPPPELVQQWYQDADHQLAPYYVFVAHCAAQWGADMELEACRDWLFLNGYGEAATISKLIAARRPKPPTLKEQALAALEVIPKLVGFESERDAIRHALETLSND